MACVTRVSGYLSQPSATRSMAERFDPRQARERQAAAPGSPPVLNGEALPLRCGRKPERRNRGSSVLTCGG